MTVGAQPSDTGRVRCRRPATTSLLQTARVVAIRSAGRDGSMDATGQYTPGFFIGTDYDQDIVWSDGYFVRAPGGVNATTN